MNNNYLEEIPLGFDIRSLERAQALLQELIQERKQLRFCMTFECLPGQSPRGLVPIVTLLQHILEQKSTH